MKVLLIIIAVIVAIGFIPVGVDFNFVDMKLTLSAKVLGKLIQIFPKSGKKKKEKPAKEKKEPAPEKKPKPKKEKKPRQEKDGGLKLTFTFDEILEMLRRILRKFGRFNRSFNVDRFLLHYTAAGKDPYNTAIQSNYVNSILSSLAPLCERRFRCKDSDVWTDIDFMETIPKVDLGAAIVIRIGAFPILAFGLVNAVIAAFVRDKFRILKLKLFDKEGYQDELERQAGIQRFLDKIKAKLAAKKKSGEAEELAPDAETVK